MKPNSRQSSLGDPEPRAQRLEAVRGERGILLAVGEVDHRRAEHRPEPGERNAARRAQLSFRRDALVAALGEHLPEWRFTVPAGGGDVFAGPSGDTLSWGAAAFLFDTAGNLLAVARSLQDRPIPPPSS